MFLKHRDNGHMIEVLGLDDLFNPLQSWVIGRYHYGEEAQDPEKFGKTDVGFLSGEPLPRCWTDIHYRDQEVAKP